MKLGIAIGAWLFSFAVWADSLPVITLPPSSQTVTPGSTATFNVTATGATSYQWRFNGVDIAGATAATLQLPNAQTNNSGYYLAIAKNATGWVPSQMAWLSVVGSNGLVPFSNIANTNSPLGQAYSKVPFAPINGSAQIMAGPALDQMGIIVGNGNKTKVTNGWFNLTRPVLLPTVAPGQTVYYSVYITATNNSLVYTQQSTVISLVAGGNGIAVPSTTNLLFPAWIEWPNDPYLNSPIPVVTNQIRVVGETFSLTNIFSGDDDLGVPTLRWRKDGIYTGSLQSFQILGPFAALGTGVLTISNAQPSDAGVYDVDVRGNNWVIGPKIYVSIQTANGQGVFQNLKISSTNFISDLVGAVGRKYEVQWATNLSNWNDLMTLTNVNGTVSFTNSSSAASMRFYRTVLLP